MTSRWRQYVAFLLSVTCNELTFGVCGHVLPLKCYRISANCVPAHDHLKCKHVACVPKIDRGRSPYDHVVVDTHKHKKIQLHVFFSLTEEDFSSQGPFNSCSGAFSHIA